MEMEMEIGRKKHTPDKIAAKCDLLIDIDTFESIYRLIELFDVRTSCGSVRFVSFSLFLRYAQTRQFLIDLK